MSAPERKRQRKSRWGDVEISESSALAPNPPSLATQQGLQGLQVQAPMAPPNPPLAPQPHVIQAQLKKSSSAPELQEILGKIQRNVGGGASTSSTAGSGSAGALRPFQPMIPPGTREDKHNRIYIGNIPFDITQASIEALFSCYGHVSRATPMPSLLLSFLCDHLWRLIFSLDLFITTTFIGNNAFTHFSVPYYADNQNRLDTSREKCRVVQGLLLRMVRACVCVHVRLSCHCSPSYCHLFLLCKPPYTKH
jgi:hypothetical protein